VSGSVIVRMWEAKAEPGRMVQLLAYVTDRALPQIEVLPLHISSEVFTSTDDRIVVISKWRSDPVDLPGPPATLVTRAPHSWDFTQVDR
jgi:hypothetical protein